MVNGVLLLHKPVGMTSHDCVMKIRKLLKTKKVGHTGTLDPEVSGVLPICVGRPQRLLSTSPTSQKRTMLRSLLVSPHRPKTRREKRSA